ncbi:arylesterase [Desulfuromonas sp.]|uniref:arylesterase n=1 Tax=Desulfuromonas sp. TaxID=892 RepID=UPI0025BD6FF4|nr:arylesterase [Desulfuromonas sp.]
MKYFSDISDFRRQIGARRHPVVWMCMLLLLLPACKGPERIAPLAPGAVVLAFGDSLTYGTGAKEEASYPAVLKALTGFTVVNAGVPGEISAEGLRRLPALLKAHRPQLVVLCHGGNDFLRRLDPRQTEANLQKMVELARAHGADVVLVGVPQFGLFPRAAPFYESVAEKHRLPYAEEILTDILTERSLKSDPIHPNAEGYRQLAEALTALIRKAQGG